MTARPEPVSEQKQPVSQSSSVSKREPSGVSMDVLSLFRLIARQWRVTVPAALLTLTGLVGALQLSSPTYEATGSIVLLSPPEAPDVDATSESTPPDIGQNPFARYGDLSVVADILVRVMDGDSKHAEFESLGVTGYEVVANRFQRGPVVDVTGQGPSPEAAIGSAETVLTEVSATLAELQEAEGADPDYFIDSAPLEPPSTATAMYGSTVRAAIAVAALGALCTLGFAVLADAFARRRAARPIAAKEPVMSDAASPGAEGAAANGSTKVGWPRILSALRLAQAEQSEQKAGGQKTAEREPSKRAPSKREPAPKRTARREPSKREPAWRKATRTFQEEPSSESAADNGHEQPATDRSP